MIVKVQRPLDDPNAPWLIYDQSDKFHMFLPSVDIPYPVQKALRVEPKAYFYAELVGPYGDQIVFGVQAPAQEW